MLLANDQFSRGSRSMVSNCTWREKRRQRMTLKRGPRPAKSEIRCNQISSPSLAITETTNDAISVNCLADLVLARTTCRSSWPLAVFTSSWGEPEVSCNWSSGLQRIFVVDKREKRAPSERNDRDRYTPGQLTCLGETIGCKSITIKFIEPACRWPREKTIESMHSRHEREITNV